MSTLKLLLSFVLESAVFRLLALCAFVFVLAYLIKVWGILGK